MSSVDSIKKFEASLRRMPTVVAQKVAEAAAPVLTRLAQETFSSGENAYGSSWVIRKDGTRATLRQSGSLASKIQYVAIGTRLRVALGVSYAKYVVGKRPVTPRQGAPLPVAYASALSRLAAEVCAREMAS
jgi:hypothetical protein